jgi:RHS repeat-associated protein
VPESGTTTYSYTNNSTGLVVMRKRPKANQTNTSILTTTTTQHDLLGRVVSIGYDDGTPTKTFAYDKSAGTNFTDMTQLNLKGRLSLASVSNAMTAYSYDAVGRAAYLDECLPSGCGTPGYNRQLHYVFDLAGNVTSSTDGASVTTTYTVSPASEMLSLTSSRSDSTDPANLVSNVQNGPNGPVSYTLGNGLAAVHGYDALGRLNGGSLCSNSSTSLDCGGIPFTVYNFTNGWKGSQLQHSTDTVLNQNGQSATYGYDEFNRLSSRTINSVQDYTWVYDRYGNRWQQNAQSGLNTPLSFNSSTNQITGYSYDAAGNLTNDGSYAYTYDAEGNIVAVKTTGGATVAQYVYNALNQRVKTAVTGEATTEFVFNAGGQRVSEWDGTTRAPLKGKYYWGGSPVAFYSNASTHFEHQDWLGTERMRTAYNGVVEGSYQSTPFGDSQTAAGSDLDAYHYAVLDYDTETSTDHAQFRQYSNTQGRWLSPDPYRGSYDAGNPQSLNPYNYVLNNPLTWVDSSGLVCRITVFGVRNNEGEYGESGSVYPYSGQSLFAALGSIFSQSMFGPNGATQQVADAINQNSAEPGGIVLIGFSGGAQTISTAIQWNLVNPSTISSITYLSPGLGLGGSLANAGDTAAFAGSGLLDGIATLNARLSGATLTPTGTSGHNFLREFNSAPVQQRVSGISPCAIKKNGVPGGGGGGGGGGYGSWGWTFWTPIVYSQEGNAWTSLYSDWIWWPTGGGGIVKMNVN